MALTVEPVQTRSELAEFITLPRRLYQGMAGYVPPLDRERRELLDPKRSPFFSHGRARYWIARENARPVGRISAQIDELQQGEGGGETGLFGCLDAIDNREVVGALLHEAEQWLAEHGRRHVRGPFLLSINGEPGLLVEGQLAPPMIMLPWHPQYLDGHLRAFGYERAMGLECHSLDFRTFEHHARLNELRHARRSDFKVKNLRRGHLEEDTELGRRLYNDGWQFNWGFTPIAETEMRALARNIRPFLWPDSGYVVEVKDEPAAFALVMPNISELGAGLGPAPSLPGWARFIFRAWRGRYKSVRWAILGVASKYRNTLLGARIAAATLEESHRRLRAHGVERIVAGWVLETNVAMIRIMRSLGYRRSHLYQIYERTVRDRDDAADAR